MPTVNPCPYNAQRPSRALHQTDRGTIERRTILAQLDGIERQMCMALQFPTYP